MKQLINLKKTCPPGFIYLNIWFATFLIFSGCIADSTNISVTISRRRNKYNHLSSSLGVLNSREHKYQVLRVYCIAEHKYQGYYIQEEIQLKSLIFSGCTVQKDSTNIRVTISRKRNNDLMKLKSMIFFAPLSTCTIFNLEFNACIDFIPSKKCYSFRVINDNSALLN